MQANQRSDGYDFVAIVPDFTFCDAEGNMATPCYLRPVTDSAVDFVNMAYAMHKRGLGNSILFDNVGLFEYAMKSLTVLGLKVEVL